MKSVLFLAASLLAASPVFAGEQMTSQIEASQRRNLFTAVCSVYTYTKGHGYSEEKTFEIASLNAMNGDNENYKNNFEMNFKDFSVAVRLKLDCGDDCNPYAMTLAGSITDNRTKAHTRDTDYLKVGGDPAQIRLHLSNDVISAPDTSLSVTCVGKAIKVKR